MGGNGDPGGTRPGRRVRVDRWEGDSVIPVPLPLTRPLAAVPDRGGRATSGRVFVTAAVLTVLVVWASLYWTFRQWRSRYRERAAFGARHVADAVAPLATVVPAGELPAFVRAAGCAGAAPALAWASPLGARPADWRRAVGETRAMLVTLTASNLLDVPRMRALGDAIARDVAAARPETARAVLAAVWDDAERRAGPVVRARHPRPRLLPPSRPAAKGR